MATAEEECLSLKMASYNILAPCNRRIDGVRESTNRDIYMLRNMQVISVIQELQSLDILCLQELWLDEAFLEFFHQKMTDKFVFYGQSRSWTREGVAIYVNKRLKVVQVVRDNHFYSGRPFLNVYIDAGKGFQVIISSIHLTFSDHLERRSEIKTLIEMFQKKNIYNSKVVGVIFCGDFNSTKESDIIDYVLKSGFQSSFYSVNNREPILTHKDHRGRLLTCDFFFHQSYNTNFKIMPTSTQVHPLAYPEHPWPAEYTASDHRMLSIEYKLTLLSNHSSVNIKNDSLTSN